MTWPDDPEAFELRKYDAEAVSTAANDLHAVAARMQRYDTLLYDEILPLLGTGTPEERADAAGRASCLSQEVIDEIEHLRAICASVHRATPGIVAEALSEYLARQEPPLRALATKAQELSTQLLWRR